MPRAQNQPTNTFHVMFFRYHQMLTSYAFMSA